MDLLRLEHVGMRDFNMKTPASTPKLASLKWEADHIPEGPCTDRINH